MRERGRERGREKGEGGRGGRKVSEGREGNEREKEGMEGRGRGGGRRKDHSIVLLTYASFIKPHVYWYYTVATSSTYPVTSLTEPVECGGHVTLTLASQTAQTVPFLVGGASNRAPPLPPGRKCQERYLEYIGVFSMAYMSTQTDLVAATLVHRRLTMW